jgi:hypothetical protein
MVCLPIQMASRHILGMSGRLHGTSQELDRRQACAILISSAAKGGAGHKSAIGLTPDQKTQPLHAPTGSMESVRCNVISSLPDVKAKDLWGEKNHY